MIASSHRRRLAAATSVALLAAGCGIVESGSDPASPAVTTTSAAAASSAAPSVSALPTAPPGEPTSPWPADPSSLDAVPAWSIEILDTTPHDPGSYTQGLELADGVLYESGGLYGESSIRIVDPATGDVTRRVDLEPALFGEGLTVVGDELVQITWREGRALRWDRQTLEPLGEWTYEGEGWGLCLMGDRLVMSDGTSRLTWRDPSDFSAILTVEVTLAGNPVQLLNELECIGDLVVANVYKTTFLVVIDPTTGDVLATIDATAARDLVPRAITDVSGYVLNGIADPGDGTLLLGGKLWPEMFTVRVIEP